MLRAGLSHALVAPGGGVSCAIRIVTGKEAVCFEWITVQVWPRALKRIAGTPR